MSTRCSVFLLVGLAGCAMTYRSPSPGHVVVVDPGPRLVVVVGTDLRYCEECDEDVFFYSNAWWAYRSGGWYSRGSWGAPWAVVELGRLPTAFIDVPPTRFKHRYGPRHPAHDHHPDRDRWTPDPSPGHGDGGRSEPAVEARPEPGHGGRDGEAEGHGRQDAVNRDRAPDHGGNARVADDKHADDQGAEKVKEKKDADEVKDKENSKAKDKEKEKKRGKSRGKSSKSGPGSR